MVYFSTNKVAKCFSQVNKPIEKVSVCGGVELINYRTRWRKNAVLNDDVGNYVII